MKTAIQTKAASLRAAAKALDTANGVVATISFLGAIALLGFGLVSDGNFLMIGGAIALAVQAWLAWTLISALVSKLELDAALGSAEI